MDGGNLARRRGVGEARARKRGTGRGVPATAAHPPAAAIVLGSAPILVPDARVDSGAARSAEWSASDEVAACDWM